MGLYAGWLRSSQQHLTKRNSSLKEGDIYPGQKISLMFDKVSKSNFENNRLDYHQETERDFLSSYQIIGTRRYKVLEGDTLWELCYNKFSLPYWLLKKYNRDLNFNDLTANQHLTIPLIEEI